MFVEKQTREKVEAAKPIQDHANRRDPTRMRICVRHNLPDENFHRVARKSSPPLERHGNVHRGAFKGDRAEFAFGGVRNINITARRSPDRVFFRTLLASRREIIRRMGAAALSAAPRFGVTRRRRASAPRTRNRELLVGGAPLQAAPRATRDLPPCRRRSQASRPRCRSTAGGRL